jgi:hypothetical protein
LTVKRKNSAYLDEPLALLDHHLDLHNGNVALARNSLGRVERLFIEDEVTKCSLDQRYYLENYHCIRYEGGEFKAFAHWWDSQEIFYDTYKRLKPEDGRTRIIVLKARQVGLSTFTQAICFHKAIFNFGINSLIAAQDPTASENIYNMALLAWEYLPWWMRPERSHAAKGQYLVFDRANAKERFTRRGLKSQIIVESANKMTGAAVGKSFSAVHMSELSFWADAAVLTQHMMPAFMNAPELFAVMESTARGKQGFWYRFWVSAVEGRIPWEPIFIEWFRRREYSLPIRDPEFERSKDEKALCAKVKDETGIEIVNEQLHWRRMQIAQFTEADGDEFKFYQEYPSNWLEAFQSSGICVFDKKKLHSKLTSEAAKPFWCGEIGLDVKTMTPKLRGRKYAKTELTPPQKNKGTRLHLWEPPRDKAEYYVGGDVAYGMEGGDFSCAYVIEKVKGSAPDRIVAEWHGWIRASGFAHVLVGLAILYNNATVTWEMNDIGRSVGTEIVRGLEYANIYRWVREDKIKNFMTDYFGFETNAKTKPQIINAMNEAVDDDLLILRSGALIDQMTSYAQDEVTGKIEGTDGNDDRVMAIMITWFCMYQMEFGESQDQHTVPKEELPKGTDFYNTAFSPVWDKPGGVRHEMVVKGQVPPELVLHNEIHRVGQSVDDDEAWKLW